MTSSSTIQKRTPVDPRPVQIEDYFTVEAKKRTYGSLKDIVAGSVGKAGVIGLHGGLPPPNCFPIAGMELIDSERVDIKVDPDKLADVQLQYTISPLGYQPLQQWAEQHVRKMHAPPAPTHVMITDGNSHALEILTTLFMHPGDSILVEEYTYPHMIECVVQPKQGVPLPLPCDQEGIIPSQLRRVLEGLQAAHAAPAEQGTAPPPFPRLLYTVPVGQNPTGAVAPRERQREIYQICREYGILIIVDDPYFYLQFPEGSEEGVPGVAGLAGGGGYLSMDVDGRVIRLDSFAKFFSPGLRLGWACAQPAVIDRMATLLQGHSLGAVGVTQLMTWQLLDAWGPAGLERHVSSMQREYAERARIAHQAAESELTGLAEWNRPVAGMFMWVKLLGVEDSLDLMPAFQEAGVVVVPGRICHARGSDPTFKCPWIRMAFSFATHQQLREGMRRVGEVLRKLPRASSSGEGE